jgi:hypothetical protein
MLYPALHTPPTEQERAAKQLEQLDRERQERAAKAAEQERDRAEREARAAERAAAVIQALQARASASTSSSSSAAASSAAEMTDVSATSQFTGGSDFAARMMAKMAASSMSCISDTTHICFHCDHARGTCRLTQGFSGVVWLLNLLGLYFFFFFFCQAKRKLMLAKVCGVCVHAHVQCSA